MALIEPSGSLVSCVNGKVGDVVFYRGRWGPVARQWVNPTNTITPERTAVRNNFATMIAFYNSLTADIQQEWDIYAATLVKRNRISQAYTPTGLQVFMERNLNLSTVVSGPLFFPPVDTPFPQVHTLEALGFTATTIPIQGTFTNGGFNIPAPTRVAYYATDNVAAHVVRKKNRYRFMRMDFPPNSLSKDLFPQWSAAWGPSVPTPGMKIFVKVVSVNFNTGQASPPFYCSQIVS